MYENAEKSHTRPYYDLRPSEYVCCVTKNPRLPVVSVIVNLDETYCNLT